MKILVIVGCGKTKRDVPSKAKDLYTGQLFRAARKYAETHGDGWVIMSAGHGLLDPNQKIEPYDRTLVGMGFDDRRQVGAWCQADFRQVMQSLGAKETNGQYPRIRIVLLAGQDYAKTLTQFTWLRNHKDWIEQPLAGLGIGERLAWFKARASQVAEVKKAPMEGQQRLLFDLQGVG